MLNNTNADWTRRSVSAATLGAIGAIAAGPTSALANTVTVSTTDQLTTALSRARGGETILIAPGEYGFLFVRNRLFPSRVTIRGQDARRPPRFAMVRVDNCANIDLVSFDCGGSAKPVNQGWLGFLDVRNSQKIVVRGVRVNGVLDHATGYSDDLCVNYRNCSEVNIESCSVDIARIALSLQDCRDVTVTSNSFTRVCGDAMRCAGVENGVFSSNSVTRFLAHPTFHNDGFQIFTSSSAGPCNNIVVRDNIFVYGQGLGSAQGIFIRSETLQPHQNIRIENNLIYTEVWHSINLSNTIGGLIRNNTAIVPPDVEGRQSKGRRGAWILVGQNSQDVLVERNVANSYTFGDGVQGIRHVDNVQVRRSSDALPRNVINGVTPSTYREVFGTETLGWTPPVSSLIVRSNPLGRSGVRIGYQG